MVSYTFTNCELYLNFNMLLIWKPFQSPKAELEKASACISEYGATQECAQTFLSGAATPRGDELVLSPPSVQEHLLGELMEASQPQPGSHSTSQGERRGLKHPLPKKQKSPQRQTETPWERV